MPAGGVHRAPLLQPPRCSVACGPGGVGGLGRPSHDPQSFRNSTVISSAMMNVLKANAM